MQPVKPITKKRKNTVPLIIEPYPKDYEGFPFITLIQYRKSPLLTIVDNADDNLIHVYILDLCGPEKIDEEGLFTIASEWYNNNRDNYPISIEFSKRGLTLETSRIYRTLTSDFVSRVIGPIPIFPMKLVKSVKRRRRKQIPLLAYLES